MQKYNKSIVLFINNAMSEKVEIKSLLFLMTPAIEIRRLLFQLDVFLKFFTNITASAIIAGG